MDIRAVRYALMEHIKLLDYFNIVYPYRIFPKYLNSFKDTFFDESLGVINGWMVYKEKTTPLLDSNCENKIYTFAIDGFVGYNEEYESRIDSKFDRSEDLSDELSELLIDHLRTFYNENIATITDIQNPSTSIYDVGGLACHYIRIKLLVRSIE